MLDTLGTYSALRSRDKGQYEPLRTLLFCEAQTDTASQALTLEELDQVFSVSTRKHARYQFANANWHFQTWVLRRKLEPLPPFYRQSAKLMEA